MLLNREVSGKWDWDGRGRNQASATRDLRELLGLNPRLRLFVAHGRSDLVTPYGVTRYILDHLPEISPANRVLLKVYKGGHMMYIDAGTRSALTADANTFYRVEGSL
jgi:carboxypeptidase C (cathepsin A)